MIDRGTIRLTLGQFDMIRDDLLTALDAIAEINARI